jgi:protein dithiol:quinone oxidoreductase
MMLSRLPVRALLLALFLFCLGLLGFGLYLQHYVGLEPCPMCIMQRYALAAVALIALVGAAHGPQAGGARVYGALIALVSLGGGGVAARQSWIQRYPPDIPECGPGLEFMLESFGIADALPMIFRGAGDCSVIDWTFLGLSIANWSFLNFAAIALFALWLMVRKVPRRWY